MFKSLFGSSESPQPDAPISLLDRLKAGIQKTRSGLIEKLEDAVSGRKEIDADVLEEVEYALITADIGANTTAEILERIRQRVERHQLGDAAEIKTLIRDHLLGEVDILVQQGDGRPGDTLDHQCEQDQDGVVYTTNELVSVGETSNHARTLSDQCWLGPHTCG